MQNRLYLPAENIATACIKLNNSNNLHNAEAQLSLEGPIILKDGERIYTLCSHSVVVQSDILTYISRSAHYLYSAQLIDDHGENYFLSVRFDNEDQQIDDIDFVVATNSIHSKVQGIPHSLAMRFLYLAQNACQPIMAEIRKQLHASTTSSQEELETDNKQLTAQLNSNAQLTLASVDTLNRIQNNLDNLNVVSRKRILQNFLSILDTLEEHMYAIIESTNSPTNSVPTCVKSTIEVSVARANELKNTIEILMQSQVWLNSLPPLIGAFVKFEAAMHEIALATYDSSNNYCLTTLLSIYGLHYFHLKTGRQLLARLLLTNQTELAKQLTHFVALDTDKLMLMGLKKFNSALLEFVILHGQFGINSTYIEEDLNAVNYLIKKSLSANPAEIDKIAACLRVLIKHGASTMIAAPGELPAGYQLLTSPHQAIFNVFHNSFSSDISMQIYLEHLLDTIKDQLSATTDANKLTMLFAASMRVKLFIEHLARSSQPRDIMNDPLASIFVQTFSKYKFLLLRTILNLPQEGSRATFLRAWHSIHLDSYQKATSQEERAHEQDRLLQQLDELRKKTVRVKNLTEFQYKLLLFGRCEHQLLVIDSLKTRVMTTLNARKCI